MKNKSPNKNPASKSPSQKSPTKKFPSSKATASLSPPPPPIPKSPVEKVTVEKIKGRAMLYWAGKSPIRTIKHYPAQLVAKTGGTAPTSPHYKELESNWRNLLFHGDNKEVLSSLLTSGFRGKVDLIYIDPPFDSKADYVKKISLRGSDEKLKGAEQSFVEQVQYTDLWKNDEYLQFMYERLILLRELLSDKGSIYLHCDWHKSHHLRMLLDEVFGEGNFRNEIVWCYTGPSPANKNYPKKHDNIFFYSKSDKYIFSTDKIRIKYKAEFTHVRGVHGKKDYNEESQKDRWEQGKIPEDWWADMSNVSSYRNELLDYPTQKPEALLERIITASSDENSIIFDCFMGSGTTAAVAEKLGRRWIGTDCNKGAIQTTIKRLQKIINDKKQDLTEKGKVREILHYRVNHYDFLERIQAREIIFNSYGIQKINDRFFDGTLGDNCLVKILGLDNPFTKLDLQQIKDALTQNRKEDTRDVHVFCNGHEVSLQSELDRHNRRSPINKITMTDIQQDGLTIYQPAKADVEIKKTSKKVVITIKEYLSPTVIKRLADEGLFEAAITDFRSQIDAVLIDTHYDGKVFSICHSDIPEKKKDFIKGEYELDVEGMGTSKDRTIAVKIVDVMGEEIITTG